MTQRSFELRITGAIKEATRENACHEGGLKSLENKRWYTELAFTSRGLPLLPDFVEIHLFLILLFSGISSRCVPADYILC